MWLTDLFEYFGHRVGPIEKSLGDQNIAVGEESERVYLVQLALRSAGHELQPDKEFGPITNTAVKVFQAAHNLFATGYVDKATAIALDKVLVPTPQIVSKSVLKTTPWVSDVRACTGIKEVPGAANSPIIMSWRNDFARLKRPDIVNYAATYTGDSIPWCGFGLGASMARCGIIPPFGPTATDKFMWAHAWAHGWGTKLDRPIPGCVMVFGRPQGGHVSMLERLDGNTALIRGFNQSDMVNVSQHSMSQFVAAVWPPGFAIAAVEGIVTNAVPQGKVT